jgi:hypothetical protein
MPNRSVSGMMFSQGTIPLHHSVTPGMLIGVGIIIWLRRDVDSRRPGTSRNSALLAASDSID